ncbi:MAG: DUF4863 family protein [Acetobacteraceae bacterium]|nr:DUF4863 family protein [Acetobacteraceae bacterium]MCX7685700.1 DUF4863 family protein [Acetobacteraceae bacterium]MDW8399126.1 DUF4863 family protein [Acetobacteraceae bacterium]
MSLAEFERQLAGVAQRIAGLPVEPALAATLTEAFPPEGETFGRIEALCRQGIAEGWLCGREAGGIRFGRAIRPGPGTAGFSVDVVLMEDVEGPHHIHPNGEIDMIMPETPGATFDGAGRGWLVYGPGSAHRPTVSGGRAIVLYLLPQGAIAFTR